MDFDVFLDRIGICDGGKAVFNKLHSQTETALIESAYKAYDAGDEAFVSFLEQFAETKNVTVEEANLYLYLHMCGRTYAFYQSKQIEDAVFYATMKAFSSACIRCYDKFGVYGIQQRVYRAWYRRQLDGTLFRLGRLEFEIIKSNYDVTLNAIHLAKGDTCISAHIPGGAALDPEESEAAYDLARTFFRDKFRIEPCVFYCGSWLLHPWLAEDLPADSRIVQFQKMYTLVDVLQDEGIVRDWLFANDPAPYAELPVKTSLHKAAVFRLQNGLPIGQARGYRL